MLGPVQTLFPKAIEIARAAPVWVRVVLLLLVVALPVAVSFISPAQIEAFLQQRFSVTPLQIIAGMAVLAAVTLAGAAWTRRARKRRQVYDFCDAWLRYLPFMFMLVTRIQANGIWRDEDMFDFIEANRSELKKFHEWRDRLRELLFKTGETQLCIGTNQHWEKLKEETQHSSVKAYMSPFSFLLDQTQPWLIAVAYEKEGWAALHIWRSLSSGSHSRIRV